MEDEEILMTLQVATARRLVAVSAQGLLGLLFVYLSFTFAGSLLARLALLLASGGCLLGAITMYSVTRSAIELTNRELRETSGKVLAKLDDIASVDRGAFAFKPTNGFIVVLKETHPRAWRLGLWWRFGKRIGIGGVTNVGQNKAMAEILGGLLEKRISG